MFKDRRYLYVKNQLKRSDKFMGISLGHQDIFTVSLFYWTNMATVASCKNNVVGLETGEVGH